MSLEPVLPNLIQPGLKLLFVGINPGLRSAAIGHHFAGHSNRFWPFLAASGLTPGKLTALQDAHLLSYGYGITNIVPRPSAAAAELTPAELRIGAEELRGLLRQHQPKVAAYLGKVVYQYLSGQKDFSWGEQPKRVVPEVIDFVLPNPSGLNRMKPNEQLSYYLQLKTLIVAFL